MGTIDGNLIALDARDGHLIWSTKMGRAELGYAATVAPLIVKDKVIAGPAGGELGISGYLAAYSAESGKEVWRFYTAAGSDDPVADKTWGGAPEATRIA